MTSEFQLINEFVSHFRARGPAVRIGPGDDCAVMAPSREELCVTTDAVVEHVHFTRPAFSFEDIGHKALAVNLSDLAAMGAKPLWFQCAIAMPRSVSRADVRSLARGMSKLAKAQGCVLSGGNFTRASELSITITVAGTVKPGTALLRNGAKANDALYVSGTLGDAAMALVTSRRSASDRQRRPEPRIALGLIARKYAHAAIDISDGLLQDLAHVCSASNVRAEVDVAALPLSRAVRAAGEAGVSWALTGGEDYELLLAVPTRSALKFERACAQAGQKVIRIGSFRKGRGISVNGAPFRLLQGRAGHDHFIDAPVSGD